jgi:hypothetical protein
MKWYDKLGVTIALALSLAIYLSPSNDLELMTVRIICNESNCIAKVDDATILFKADSLETVKHQLRSELNAPGRYVRLVVRHEP